jgi:5'-AMP-activated protein kinase regulatory beta subunit
MKRKRKVHKTGYKEPKVEEIEKPEVTVTEEVVKEDIEQPFPEKIASESEVKSKEEAEGKATESEKAEAPTSSVTVSWRPHQPEKIFIVGNFNDWNPESHPLTLDENGEWKIKLELPPGTYEYRFVIDGEWICDPNCEESVPNSFGGYNSLLTVK